MSGGKALPEIATITRDARKRMRLSQSELGKLSGVDPENIKAIERGRIQRPDADIINRLAAALDIPVTAYLEAMGFDVKSDPEINRQAGWKEQQVFQAIRDAAAERLRQLHVDQG